MNKLNHFELSRKILHVVFGIIGLMFLIFDLITQFQIFIILLIGIAASLIYRKVKIPILSYFLENFERPKEKQQLPGRAMIFAVAGALLSLQLFSRNIALASITILIFADPVSHFIGKVFGKTHSFFDKRKNIEGHIAGALISSLLAWFFVPFYLALTGAIAAMLLESLIIEIQKIELDDNLIIPLAAGTAMRVVVRFIV